MCSFGSVFSFSKASYNALTSSFIAEQKIRWCNAKRRRQREGEKTLCTSSTLFLISLPLFRTTTAWNFLWVTPFNKDNLACAHKIFCFLCSFLLFFFNCRWFSPRWSLAFLIFSPPLYNFHVVVPCSEIRLLCFVSHVLALSLLSTKM